MIADSNILFSPAKKKISEKDPAKFSLSPNFKRLKNIKKKTNFGQIVESLIDLLINGDFLYAG